MRESATTLSRTLIAAAALLFATPSQAEAAKSAPGDVTSGLTSGEIASTIRAGFAPLRACYLALQKRQADAGGKLTVRFTVKPDGAVDGIGVVDSTLPDATFQGCLHDSVASWHFPAPRDGQPVRVHYPLVFSPT
jgi:TonB family protein